MKKYSAILLTALALGFASCEDKSDLGIAQINPQGPVVSAMDIQYYPFTYIDATEPTLGDVNLGFINVKGLPADYQIAGKLQLSDSKDFSKVIEVPVSCTDKHLYGSIGDIAAQYTEKFSKDPDVVQFYGRTSLTATASTGEAIYIGKPGEWLAQDTVYTLTPVPAAKILDSQYCIVLGDGTNWDWNHMMTFNHSDINQYDDPVFSFTLKTPSAIGNKWMILPGSDAWKVAYGEPLAGHKYFLPVYDRTVSDVIYGDLEPATSGNINPNDLPSIDVPCEISINVLDNTYSVKPAVENYYVTGNGWANWGSNAWMPLFTQDFTNYYGFLNLGTEFKFSPVAGWNGDFGAANAPAESGSEGAYIYKGSCHDSGNNIVIGHAGLYFCNLNANDWNYTLTQTSTWGLIGDFNGWGGDIEMTPSDDLYKWTADLTVTSGQGWKFRANGNWDFNLGGTENALWTNGDNIVLPDAGTYTITLDLTSYPAKFTAVKK